MSLPLCEICQQNEALVWIGSDLTGQKEQHYYCESCIRQAMAASLLEAPASKSTLQKLDEMWGEEPQQILNDVIDENAEQADALRCKSCKTLWKDIQKGGLMGCPACYASFAEKVAELAEELHQSTCHSGKVPRMRLRAERQERMRRKRQQHRLEMLQKRLDEALREERYEEAAQIRDKIAQVS